MNKAAIFLCLGLASSTVGSAQAAGVRIQVESRPGLTFNRTVPSVVTLKTPWGTQMIRLAAGTLYTGDPTHYWSSLTPVFVHVRTPPNIATGRYPVSIQADLYVCDQRLHLCSVRPAVASGLLEVGSSTPLRMTLEMARPLNY